MLIKTEHINHKRAERLALYFKREKKLPVVLSPNQVQQIIECTTRYTHVANTVQTKITSPLDKLNFNATNTKNEEENNEQKEEKNLPP